MGRLIASARYRPGEASNSREIDEGFDRVVGALIEAVRKEREEELNKSPPSPPGIQYYIQGHFSEDGMPITLKENFRAENIGEAKLIIERKARYYHNLEGYAVSLNLFGSVRSSQI